MTKSKIAFHFNATGRSLFESEKAAVAAFIAKYSPVKLDSIEEEIKELESELYYAEEEVCGIENALQELYKQKQELLSFKEE